MTSYRKTHWLTAWGQRRTVTQGAEDDGCSVDYVTILQRVERGWTPKDAITTPSLRRYELTAWGETKRLSSGRGPPDAAAEPASSPPVWHAAGHSKTRLPRHLTLASGTKTIGDIARVGAVGVT